MISRRRGAAVLALAYAGFAAAPALGQPAEEQTAIMQDCPICPQMVVIPPGTFAMGSEEAGLPDDEKPRRTVTIERSFAISRFEITLVEFLAFADVTSRQPGPDCFGWNSDGIATNFEGGNWVDPGFAQTDRSPVTCVSWEDARDYARWLSERTGETYRLPSEAEWEYVRSFPASDGGQVDGASPALCEFGNVADISAAEAMKEHAAVTRFNLGRVEAGQPLQLDSKFSLYNRDVEVPWEVAACRDGTGLSSAPVGSYKPNKFGVHDLVGNLWEWTQDCWVEGYADAPADGAAVASGLCEMRSLRGGAWAMNTDGWRIADRDRDHPGRRYAVVGIRLVREL